MTAFLVCTGLSGVRVDRVDHPSRCCTGPQATPCMGRASYELISPHLSYLFPTSLFLSHHSITLSFVSSRKFGFPADIVYPLRFSCTKILPFSSVVSSLHRSRCSIVLPHFFLSRPITVVARSLLFLCSLPRLLTRYPCSASWPSSCNIIVVFYQHRLSSSFLTFAIYSTFHLSRSRC